MQMVREAAQALLALPECCWEERHDLTSPNGAELRRALADLAAALVAAEYGVRPPYERHERDRRTGRAAHRRYLKLFRELAGLDDTALRARCQEVAEVAA